MLTLVPFHGMAIVEVCKKFLCGNVSTKWFIRELNNGEKEFICWCLLHHIDYDQAGELKNYKELSFEEWEVAKVLFR